MPAPKRITDQSIEEAVLRWRGNVTAAAEQLGIAPVNLRKRIESLGLDLAVIRAGGGSHMAGTHTDVSHPTEPNESLGTVPMTPNAGAGKYSPPTPGGIFSGKGAARKLSTVEQAVEKDEVAGIPVRTVAARRKPARLEPSNEDRLVEFQRQIEARYGVDTDLTGLLNQFFEEVFQTWSSEKLSPAEAEKKKEPKK